MNSDFIENLIKYFPEIVEVSKKVAKLLSEKFKKKFDKIKKIKSKKLSKPLLISESAEEYNRLRDISKTEKYKLVEKYIGYEYWPIFILGERAREKKLSGDVENAGRIKREASERYGRKSVHFINLIIQGYFNEMIGYVMQQQKNGKADSEIRDWLNTKLNDYILYFPSAFWVSGLDNIYKIKENLFRRCVTDNLTEVSIHTIGNENIKKIESTLTELSKDKFFPEFNYDKKYESEDCAIVMFKIKIIE